MTLEQALEYTETLLQNGKTEEAVDLLTLLYPRVMGDDKIQANFLLGTAAALEGDFDLAEQIYRDILKNHPGLTRVRLELALTYFKMHKDDKADYHFRLALGAADLPAEVRRKILIFLAQIRQRKSWDYYLTLGVAPSTNINNASGAQSECISFFGIPMCRRLEEERSSLGLSGGAGVEHNLRLSRHLRIRNSLNMSLSDHSGSEFDSYGLGYSVGPRYAFRRGEAGLYASAGRFWYGGEGFQYDYGPVLNFSYDITSRLSFGLSAAHKWQTFDNYEYMHGTDSNIMTSLYVGLSSKSYILFKPSVNFLRTEREFADKNSFSLALGAGTELPWGLSLYVEPSYTWAGARGEMLVVHNGGFAFKTRRENNFNFSARLLYRQLNFLGLTPTLNYYYTRSLSNIQNASYTKHTVEMGVTRRF